MALVRVASASDMKDGENKVVTANGKQIALFRIDGQFYAMSNECPHKGGPLGEGYTDGMVVSCPWHGWKFDVCTGVSPMMPSISVPTYKTTLQDDDVMVEI